MNKKTKTYLYILIGVSLYAMYRSGQAKNVISELEKCKEENR